MSSIIGSRNRETRFSSIRPWRQPLRFRKRFSRSSPTPRTLPVALENSPGRRAISHSSVKWIWARRRRRSGIAAKSASRNRTNCIAGAVSIWVFLKRAPQRLLAERGRAGDRSSSRSRERNLAATDEPFSGSCAARACGDPRLIYPTDDEAFLETAHPCRSRPEIVVRQSSLKQNWNLRRLITVVEELIDGDL